jgi:hypothetical protein
MTRNEILAQYKIVATRCARKGELVLAVANSGGECAVVKQTGNNKHIISDILEPIDEHDVSS